MRKIFDKLLKIAPGAYYGILSAILRFSGDFLAFLYYPGYDITKYMISDLGTGPGAIFFSLGIILSGIACVPFYVAIVRALENDGIYEKTRRSSLIVFYMADTAYIMIGIFPSDRANYLIFLTHGIFALIWILTTITYLFLFCFLMLNNNSFTKMPVFFNLLLIGFLFLFLFTWVPIFEWMLSLIFFIWYAFISTYMLLYKS